MPNEPQFPSLPDIMAAVAGAGRKFTDFMPDKPLSPFPLKPYFGAYTPEITPRQVAEMFVPQSMLDVGLMAFPPARGGKSLASMFRNIDEVEAVLVPALRKAAGEKEYLGKVGQDIYHLDVYKRHNLPYKGGKFADYEHGFVDATTGEWLTRGEAATQSRVRRAYQANRDARQAFLEEAMRRKR